MCADWFSCLSFIRGGIVFRLRENSISIEKSGRISLKKIVHALICIEFFLILIHFFLFLRTNNHYRLKKIIIDGTHYTNPEKIIHSLNFSEDENIFDANLLQISRILEKNTWIESSSIKIKHPGILHISINERNPIAILKGDYTNAIDSKGKILGNIPLSLKPCLPKIYGFSGNEETNSFRNNEIKKIIVILGVFRNLTWFDNKCFSIKKTEDEFYLLRFRKRSFVVKISNERLISQIARLISVLELFPNKIRVAGNRLFFDLTFPSRVIMRRILEYGG